MMAIRILNLLAILVMPVLLSGIVTRVKSLWSGRKGAPIFQLAFDLIRLAQKTPVYSATTTPLFRVGPYVLLITSLLSAALVPLLGSEPLASFPFDFVWFAYAWALGRVASMLAALDTGSSFEGMGAAREATFSTLLEPALFLVMGALSYQSGGHTMHEALAMHLDSTAAVVIWACALVALTVVLQVETSRMPIDDPTTHLELTMIHEVMVLDHSGPELAAIQAGSAIKLFIGAAIIATLMNPWAADGTALGMLANIALTVGVAIVVGTVESLTARLKLRAIPQYIVVAISSGVIALLATAWRVGGAP